jgi:hypothetical protein
MVFSQKQFQIKTNGVTSAADGSVMLSQLVLLCSNAGSSWSLTIQDRTPAPDGGPRIIFFATTQTVRPDGTPLIIRFEDPIVMKDGIDIVTAGTTPGVVDIWGTGWQ